MAYNLNMTQGEFVTLLDGATSAAASEPGRVTEENTRKSNETARKSAETARVNAESGRSTSESTRVANENTRINGETGRKNNENVRADSENTRKTSETARASAESGRSTAETARATEEATRKTAETERINGENTRKSAETARANAESGRTTAESARATEEATRKTAENTRNTGENTRKTAESGRVTAETARATNEDARKSGESARAASENVRVDGETGRKNNEAARVDSENTRKTAETARVTAETARANETSGIVARATAQANIAGQKAVEAQTSQTNAQASATAAENSRQAIENMTVSGTTVATGGQATVTKTIIGGVANLAFGIPRGVQGVQGEKGDKGEPGGPLQIFGTYAELAALKAANALVAGRQYVLTGYKTTYQQPTTNVIKTTEISPAGERLVLTAVAGNQFDMLCSSLDFEQDIVTFDFDNVLCEDGKTPREGFILRRHDTEREIDYPHDWRTMLWARFKPHPTQYQVGNVMEDYAVWKPGEAVNAKDGKVYKVGDNLYMAMANGVPTSNSDAEFFVRVFSDWWRLPKILPSPLFFGKRFAGNSATPVYCLIDTTNIEELTTFPQNQQFSVRSIRMDAPDSTLLENNVFLQSAEGVKISCRCLDNTFCGGIGETIFTNVSACIFYEAYGSHVSNSYLCFFNRVEKSNINGTQRSSFFHWLEYSQITGRMVGTSFHRAVNHLILSCNYGCTSFAGMEYCRLETPHMRNLFVGTSIKNMSILAYNTGARDFSGITALYDNTYTKTITSNAANQIVLTYRDANNLEQSQIIP